MAREYQDVKTDSGHVDARCMWMVTNPDAYDVIGTTNMFGDIITERRGILQGGMGVAAGPSLNLAPDVSPAGRRGFSMFESMGGSTPQDKGTNPVEPIAASNAMAMHLEQMRHPAGCARIDRAAADVTVTDIHAAGRMAARYPRGRRPRGGRAASPLTAARGGPRTGSPPRPARSAWR